MKIKYLVILTACISFIMGCGKESSSESKATTSSSVPMQATNEPAKQQETKPASVAQSVTPQTPKPAVKTEEYELIEARDFRLTASIHATDFMQAADASGDIKGTLDFLRVGSTQLELETNAIVHEDNKAWILTKNYGKIRVSGGYAGDHPPSGLCWWLTPSQLANFQKLLSEHP